MNTVIDETFTSVAAGLTTPEFPVHAVAVPPVAWAHDTTIPFADALFGWTVPTPTTPDGAIIRYCPDVLDTMLPHPADDLLVTLNVLSGCAVMLLADGHHLNDPDGLMRHAEDDTELILGDIICTCDDDTHTHPTTHVDVLVAHRLTLLDKADP